MCIFVCICICNIVIFKNRTGVLYRDLKHKGKAECLGSDKARTASFFRCLLKFTYSYANLQRKFENLFSQPKKLTSSHIKSRASLSHIKTRQGYNFLLYFPHEFLKNFRSIRMYIYTQWQSKRTAHYWCR